VKKTTHAWVFALGVVDAAVVSRVIKVAREKGREARWEGEYLQLCLDTLEGRNGK
jgi:hypothetical protein